jgi:hypothetical protein
MNNLKGPNSTTLRAVMMGKRPTRSSCQVLEAKGEMPTCDGAEQFED